ncbi:phosphoglycolate phosphatase [Bacillus canaveralius]|uniref:Phosphoglycolate phosphatase n=1 Tax=Bacillus canaveralius TaxID=1403243 RepID=A0A2N5GJ88_9BACI|nr:Cof-type HAD-IIB family hydrolase [Bacillus canaveralius]PLR81169.1 phosphoglycolate phosphatase [Bacillus canaveralius]PLR95850.1 phosphoglycolate phosphatase [Bacillus canaveralius]RSK50539.1 HAD family phosphatase [Bacillus canaveralius]
MSMQARKQEIKLIALDLDGTLLNEEGKVSEINRQAIKEAEQRGVKVLVSTGRAYLTCNEITKSLELSSYLITVNGSEIYDVTGALVERVTLGTDLIKWMYGLSQEYKTGFWATCTENVWRGKMPEDITAREWMKFGFNIEDDNVREHIMGLLKQTGKLEISNSSPTNIEANAIGINKAKAIGKVCGFLGLEMQNVMAIGDSLNDIAMIREAGLGVAMGNAQEIVKATADWVTESNKNDGVAKAIYEWVLTKQTFLL